MNPFYFVTNLILAIFKGRKGKVLLFVGILIGIIIGTHLPSKTIKFVNHQTEKVCTWFRELWNDVTK